MPMILFGVVKTIGFTFLQNSGCMEKLCIILLKSLSAKTASKIDDKIVSLIEQSLAQKEKVKS